MKSTAFSSACSFLFNLPCSFAFFQIIAILLLSHYYNFSLEFIRLADVYRTEYSSRPPSIRVELNIHLGLVED